MSAEAWFEFPNGESRVVDIGDGPHDLSTMIVWPCGDFAWDGKEKRSANGIDLPVYRTLRLDENVALVLTPREEAVAQRVAEIVLQKMDAYADQVARIILHTRVTK